MFLKVIDFYENYRKSKKQSLVNKNYSKEIKISIILPALDSERTISRAIISIQNQTYSCWELIIVDDGSVDNTLKIIDKFSGSDTRIKLYKNKKNKGVAYSRNVGLYHAKGEFITFHDADDVSHPDRLTFQLFEILKNPKIEIVIFKYLRVNEKKVPYIINGKKKWNRVSGMMFRRELIDKIGFFKPTHISEDSEYHERILAVYGKKSRKIINKVLYYALFNPNSLLFSNANVEVKGNRVNYKITDEHASVLEGYRKEHKLMKQGKLDPYQPFEVDNEVTSVYKG